MKFLQHGDSVVSLRFLYQESMGGYEEAESVGELNQEAQTALTKLQDVQGTLGNGADADIPGTPDSFWPQVYQLHSIVTSNTDGALSPADQSLLDEIQSAIDTARSFHNLDGVLFDPQQDLPNAADLLPDFGTNVEREQDIQDLIDGTGEEANLLINEVRQTAEYAEAGADARMEMAELVGDITSEGLERDAKLTESGERTPDQPVMRVASTVAELPVKLDKVIASLDEETAGRFGASAMEGFSADQFA
jgi:hypothetical protein